MTKNSRTTPQVATVLLMLTACGPSAEPDVRETPPPETRDGVGTQRLSQLSLSVRVDVDPSTGEQERTSLVAVVRDLDGRVSETNLGKFVGRPVDANPTRADEILTLQLPDDQDAEALHFMVGDDGTITVLTEAADGSMTQTRRLKMPALGRVKKATPVLEHGLDAAPPELESSGAQ